MKDTKPSYNPWNLSGHQVKAIRKSKSGKLPSFLNKAKNRSQQKDQQKAKNANDRLAQWQSKRKLMEQHLQERSQRD
jgi:hypothetical protein